MKRKNDEQPPPATTEARENGKEPRPARTRFVVKLKNGLPGDKHAATKNEASALKVFKYADPLEFVGEFSPMELDTLFSFNSKYLLAGRSFGQMSEEALKLSREEGAQDDDADTSSTSSAASASQTKAAPEGKDHKHTSATTSTAAGGVRRNIAALMTGSGAKGAKSPRRSPARTAVKTSDQKLLVTLGVEVQLAEADIKTYTNNPALPTQKLLQIASDLIRGTITLHANGRAHLDITPTNCLYANGKALLSDFGACAVVEPRTFEFRRCPTTRIYAAPEAIGAAVIGGTMECPLQGEGNKRLGRVGMPNDMWSLGATLFEILTGVEFFRFLPQDESQLMLDYDDMDPAAQPEASAAWINWFAKRDPAEYKSFELRSEEGELLAVLPGRDANDAFFFNALTGKLFEPLRVWDETTAYGLAGVLSSLLELDVAKRATYADLMETPLAAWSASSPCRALPVPVDKDANPRPARAAIRGLLGRVAVAGSDAAIMTTRHFFCFVEILTRAVGLDPTLGSLEPQSLTLAVSVIAAYISAVPFEDPAENFPMCAMEWWKKNNSAATKSGGDVADEAVRVIVRVLKVLGCRLYNPFVYEASATLTEMAYLYPVIFLPNAHDVDLERVVGDFRRLERNGPTYETDYPGDARNILLQDFIDQVVRPERSAIEAFYRETQDIEDLGDWLFDENAE